MPKKSRPLLLFALSTLTVIGLLVWPGLGFQPETVPAGSGAVSDRGSNEEAYQSISPSPIAGISTPTPFLPEKPAPTSSATRTSTPTASPTPGGGEARIIGYSVEGRPLEVYRFGQGERVLLIIAGVHGGYEWNTVALADQLIEHLKENPGLIPEDKTLFILRVLNPDGYARDHGADGRANANQVDLNRNWDANWQAKWEGTQCWSKRVITAGSEPFSEPETQTLKKFIEVYQVQRIINYHSAGLGIFSGGVKDKLSQALAREMARVSPYAYPPVETDCQFTGQLVDWASSQGITAVDVELRNHTDTDFEINLEILRVFLTWEAAE